MNGSLACFWVCLRVWRPDELNLEPVRCHLMELLPSSRVGLDWACSMAEILRSLNSAPLWRDVIATFTDHCIKQLPFQLKHTNIFTLLVLVGFPQVRHWRPGLLFITCTAYIFGSFFFFSCIICLYSIGIFSRLWDGLFTLHF